MAKKQFIVEIDVPEDTGDLCWDHDKTGLQAFHDCVIIALPFFSLQQLVGAKDASQSYKDYIQRQNDVRKSFRVVRPLENE